MAQYPCKKTYQYFYAFVENVHKSDNYTKKHKKIVEAFNDFAFSAGKGKKLNFFTQIKQQEESLFKCIQQKINNSTLLTELLLIKDKSLVTYIAETLFSVLAKQNPSTITAL